MRNLLCGAALSLAFSLAAQAQTPPGMASVA